MHTSKQHPAGLVRIVNLLPHPIAVQRNGPGAGYKVYTPTQSDPARLTLTREGASKIDGVPVRGLSGAIEGLPDPEPNVFLIVSRMVFLACPDRTDLLAPDTLGDADRIEADAGGRKQVVPGLLARFGK
jgi:hypothetical protein